MALRTRKVSEAFEKLVPETPHHLPPPHPTPSSEARCTNLKVLGRFQIQTDKKFKEIIVMSQTFSKSGESFIGSWQQYK